MDQAASSTGLASGVTLRAGDAWSRPFLRIGHGGAAGRAPANTLPSLTLALQADADMVEFDVRPCRDDLVLLHDDSLLKFGAHQALASSSTLAELRRLDIEPGCFIPTLAQALDLLKGRALINIDLKAAGCEQAVLDQVAARGMAGDTLYSSLYPASLRLIRQLDPLAMTGLSFPEDRGNASSPSRTVSGMGSPGRALQDVPYNRSDGLTSWWTPGAAAGAGCRCPSHFITQLRCR